METSGNTKKILLLLISVSVILILIIIFSFLGFFKEQKKNIKQEVKTSVVSMSYKTTINGLTLTNLKPISVDVGKALRSEGSYFDFAVSSEVDDNSSIQYEIALIKDENSIISDDDIMVYLEKQNSGTYAKVEEPTTFSPVKKKSSLGSPAKSMVLDQVTVSSDQIDNYRLRIWVREGATISNPNDSYSVRVNVYGKAIE